MKKIKKIKINLNGKPIFLPKGTSVYKVIKKNKLQANKIAIEINNEIINKKKINKILLKNNDRIEIVHFIGGG
tara:strand:- start:348 stop:566 length:219 start_codon:yes stop_codon:yes gene_type:complete